MKQVCLFVIRENTLDIITVVTGLYVDVASSARKSSSKNCFKALRARGVVESLEWMPDF